MVIVGRESAEREGVVRVDSDPEALGPGSVSEWPETQQRLVSFSLQLLEATVRIVAFAYAVLLHKVVTWGLLAVTKPEWVIPRHLLECAAFVAFAVVAVALLYETVAVFVPALKPFHRQKGSANNNDNH